MRMFTNHYCHQLNAWCTGLTKNVKLLVAFLLLGSSFSSKNIFAQGAGPAPVVPPTGGMAIDGHLQRQGSVGDWLAAPAGSTAGTYLFNSTAPGTPAISAPGLIFHKLDLFGHANDEGFDGGNKLFQDPNVWGWSSKKQLNKDDMNNAMIFITTNPIPDINGINHIWALISGDRSSEHGTSYLDFEFYQNEITRTGPNQTGAPVLGGTGGFLSAGPNGGRTVGDLSVTLSFVSGGSVAGVSILQWAPKSEGGGFEYATVTLAAGQAFVAANAGIVAVPYGAFGKTTYAPNLFVEAAIDLTALIGIGGGECGGLNFKSLFIKTKSSAETTADLKDFFDPFSISLCSDRTAAVITSGGNQLALGCNPSASDISGALGTASATDNCGTATLTSSDGSVIPTGCNRSQTRTWTAVDGCGNISTNARTATWTADATAPVISANGNSLTLGCNPSASDINAALGTASASDNCGTPTLSALDGAVVSSSCGRSQTRTWTAIDGCNNSSTVSRTATWIADQTAPGITTGGSNTPLGCNPTSTAISAALGTATATDVCGTQSLTSSDGAVTSDGCARSQTRTWTARDGCGNSATASRTATWTFAATLSITCPADRQFQCTDANTSTTTAGAGVAVANGGCSPTVSFSDQETTRNCSKLIKRTWTATDACGQTVTCVQNIVVADNTPPVCINGNITDNCTAPGDILKYISNGTWTAIDGSGNIATFTCSGATRIAPTTQVIEETKPVVTETEKATSISSSTKVVPVQVKSMEVFAYPNPYSDQVNFRFVSPETGTAKLELYDMLGKQVSMVNIGLVQAGVPKSVNYKIPALKRISMIYKVTVGNQSGNGKLISGSKNP